MVTDNKFMQLVKLYLICMRILPSIKSVVRAWSPMVCFVVSHVFPPALAKCLKRVSNPLSENRWRLPVALLQPVCETNDIWYNPIFGLAHVTARLMFGPVS